MDDGSTDDSLEVARSYGDAVRVFTHPNMGVERTGNRGVEEARGELTTFLSADDVFEPTYVEELERALAAVPEASFAYCRAQMFGAGDRVLRSALRGPRARLRYLVDLALAAADIALGFSRWPWLVRALERSSWRSFERRYLNR